MTAESSGPTLARRLTTPDAIVIGVGSMVGAGLFSAFAPATQAAGALVLEGQEIPAGMLAAGLPAKVRGALDEAGAERVRLNAIQYQELAERHRVAQAGG